jgi:heme-binding NEAT domain protein
MKKFLLPLALMLAAGVAVAQAAETKSASKATAKTSASAKAPAHKSHIVDAEVVSADAAAKTITVKVDGEDKTVPVHGKAAARLGSLKAGEKVALTCVDNAKGEHEYVSAIRIEKAAAMKKSSSK